MVVSVARTVRAGAIPVMDEAEYKRGFELSSDQCPPCSLLDGTGTFKIRTELPRV